MSDDLSAIWAEVLRVLENELSGPSFNSWLKASTPVAWSNDTLVVEVPNEFARGWLETRHAGAVADAVSGLLGRRMQIKFVARAESEAGESPDPGAAPSLFTQGSDLASSSVAGPASALAPGVAQDLSSQGKAVTREPYESRVFDESLVNVLNPKYTFDSFVVGESNRFAHAAALAVSEAPGHAYNPLFIYGGVGLGKTHLMQAIGHRVVELNPAARVVYVPSEQFTNELINAIRFEKMVEFRSRYRNVDVLMVDDIQFVAGKERTQEEFFHTFNTLYEAGKQIVISSDRPPKEIATLEARLRSRFEWGLLTDIQAPDLETRVAILKKKAYSEQMDVPHDTMVYIAAQIHTNIRELEGALIRVTAYAGLNNLETTPQVAAEALKDLIPSARPKQISAELIQKTVADYYGIEVSEMRTKSRVRTVSLPRQVAMYLCRELTEMSLPKIGEVFGGRDHSTVIHACEKIQQDIKADQAFNSLVKDIVGKLQNG